MKRVFSQPMRMSQCSAMSMPEPTAGPLTIAIAGQHDHADVGVVVTGAHVLANLCHRAILLGGANQCVHPLRPIEFDPEDAVVLGFVQKIVHQLGDTSPPPMRAGATSKA